MLYGDKLEKRAKWEKLFRENPIFIPKHSISFDEQRENAYKNKSSRRCKTLFNL